MYIRMYVYISAIRGRPTTERWEGSKTGERKNVSSEYICTTYVARMQNHSSISENFSDDD